MNSNDRIYPIVFLFLLGIVVFMIIDNFIPGIVSAFVIAFFMLPLYGKLSRKLSSKLSALAIIAIIIVFLFALIYFVSSNLVTQVSTYLSEQNNTAKVLSDKVSELSPTIGKFVEESSNRIGEALLGFSLTVVKNIPNLIINAILAIFLTYYILLNWKGISSFFIKAIPFKNKKLIERVKKSSFKILYGFSIIAGIEFVISALGFYIAGLKLFLFLALLVAVAAFIPLVGPITVWLPIFIYQLIIGNTSGAIVVLITGLILSIGIDNFLMHIIVGKTSDINPSFMILGVLGGVSIFGIFGFIIGPIVLIVFVEFLKQYVEDVNKGAIKENLGK
jgi:predicted PurR-regulated permease PerM